MGQVSTPAARQSLILTATDRLVASNADGGLAIAAAHVVLLGEAAGQNMGALSYIYAIGANSLKAGIADTNLNGTTIYGAKNLPALVNVIQPSFLDIGPCEIIGYNNFPLLANRFSLNVVIGSNIAQNLPAAGLETSGSVLIGPDVLAKQRPLQSNGGSGYTECVMIGARVARGDININTNGGGSVIANSVLIGSDVFADTGANLNTPGCVANFNVAIGSQCCQRAGAGQNSAFQNNVVIGNQAWQLVTHSSTNVVIGSGITGNQQGNSGGGQFNCVLVGPNISHAVVGGASLNTGLGAGLSFSGMRSGNVLIGAGAGAALGWPAAQDFAFELTSTNGAAGGTLLTGIFGGNGSSVVGGLVLGNATALADRAVLGLNTFKILDGNRIAGAGGVPASGGYFYVAAGALHWVGSGGTDTVVAPA